MKNHLDQPRFIAVEGAIGAGKTSLVNLLNEQYHAKLILENGEKNPFLGKFYEDRQTHAFQTQIFFLLDRYQQYLELAQMDLFNSVIIIDYLFQRDRIFANLNLKGHEFQLYEKIFNMLNGKIPKPDLVIFLQARTEILLQRVQKRGREYEQNIDLEYLEAVNKAFNHYFFYYSETPLLIINTNEIDFVEKKCDLDQLINKINHHRMGREYHNPLGSG
ncbi:MAG: deoxynucleoside kinase [Nitrospinota bacterium]|nr:deoxynucleoside kinase [Nitrospinota bacterium]